MAKKPKGPAGLGDVDPFRITSTAPAAVATGRRPKAKRRTLSVPVELGDLVADAAHYHRKTVAALTVELIRAGLASLQEAEAERLEEPRFTYPRRTRSKF